MDHYGIGIFGSHCSRVGQNMNSRSLSTKIILLLMLFSFSAKSQMHHHSAAVTATKVPDKFIATKDRSYNDLVAEAMAIMDRDMMKEKSQDNPDIDFVTMMIPHHQGAIDMAKVLLLHGKDPEMKNLALQIITDQQTEIDQMKAWLKNHKPTKKKENGK